MRTITSINSLDYGDQRGGAAVISLLTGSDWSVHEGFDSLLKAAFQRLLLSSTDQALPTHIDDPRLLDALLVARDNQLLSHDQIVLREGLLILSQVPTARRTQVLASHLTPIYHYGFESVGILSWLAGSAALTIRLRQSDQSVLLEATQALAALLSSRRVTRRVRRQQSKPRGSRIVPVTEATPVRSDFGIIDLRAVGGDLVARGDVVQLHSAVRAYRYLLFDGPKRGLFLAGATLVGVSAVLTFGVHPSPDSVVDWVDGMVGRLATAAFGAQLVNTAIDYNALAPVITRHGLRFETGATIKWHWVDGRTPE